MTKINEHDLLIGIGKDIETINARLKKIESKQSCDTNREKLKTLEWMNRTAFGTAIVAGIRAFWPGA